MKSVGAYQLVTAVHDSDGLILSKWHSQGYDHIPSVQGYVTPLTLILQS
jgi:hypothetical protein